MTLMTWTIFEIPFSMLFKDEQPPCTLDAMFIINTLVDLLFLVDIVMSMNTAYFDENGILIEDRQKIVSNYLRSWFFIDFSTSLPIDGLMCMISPGAVNQENLRIIKIFRILKMARMLKFLKVLKKWENASGSKTLRLVIRLLKFLFFMLYTTHGAACAWMAMIYVTSQCFEADLVQGKCTCVEGWGAKDCLNRNWLSEYDDRLIIESEGATSASKYLASVYFAVVALTTVGFGDITPTNDEVSTLGMRCQLWGWGWEVC